MDNKHNLNHHINKVLLEKDAYKLSKYSYKIICYDLSNESLVAGISLLQEIGFRFTGEYVENIHDIKMSSDKYPWQSKPYSTEAIFVDNETGLKRSFGKGYFDRVTNENKVVAESDAQLYKHFYQKKLYGNYYHNSLNNINALLEFANKLKIKTNLTKFKVKKVRAKAPKESIEILKSYGFVFDIDA